MERRPVPPIKRSRLEAAIRVADMFVYAVAAVAGATLFAIPLSPAALALDKYLLILAVWGGLLTVGGVTGFVGRLTRYWMVESVGTVACIFGFAIHLVVLGGFAVGSITAAFTWLVVLVAFTLTFRRWLELQIFGIEPGNWRHRMEAAWLRRTADTVPHR